MRLRWWHWPLIALLVIFALGLVASAVGTRLPVHHTATVSAHIDAPPDRVWALLIDVERFPAWRPDVEAVTRLEDADGGPTWRESLGSGTLTFETVAIDSAERLVVRIADHDLPFAGAWTYELEPDAGGTRLTITENGEIHNPLFRFMSRYVFGHDATIRTYVDAVRSELGTTG
ncbi:MAG: SRPBCC family protein [Longimicrobiales bacterium]